MTDVPERMHAWSHLVLFLMLFMIALAVMRFGGPTGLAANNQSINAQGVGDLKPFLTAVGLLMGLFIAAVFALGANLDGERKPIAKPQAEQTREEPVVPIQAINHELQRIRKQLQRFR